MNEDVKGGKAAVSSSLVPWESFRKRDQLIFLAGALPLAPVSEASQGHTKASVSSCWGEVLSAGRKKGRKEGRGTEQAS